MFHHVYPAANARHPLGLPPRVLAAGSGAGGRLWLSSRGEAGLGGRV